MTAPHVVTPSDLPAPYSGPPLRVAWIGNGRHPWCSEVHFTKSMESLGHDVVFLQEDEMDWRALPALVTGRGVQAVFWTRTWPAEMDVVVPVLEELRAEGTPTISYHLDRWFGLDRAHQVDDQPFFRCLPGWVPVEAATVAGVTRRWYSGELVSIRAGEHQLSATPNHPILTSRGWVAIGELAEGDDLICYDLGQRDAGRGPQVDHGPSTIEQVFESAGHSPDLFAVSRERVSGVPMDFHGDGTYADVDVVRTLNRLVSEVDFADSQPLQDLSLFLAEAAQMHRAQPSSVLVMVGATDDSSSFGCPSEGNASLSQNPPDAAGSVAQPVVAGDRSSPFPSGVSPHYFIGDGRPESSRRDFDAVVPVAYLHPILHESSADRTDAHPERTGNGPQGFSGFVSLAQVSHVERREFSGHVFNLSTVEGAYLADGIVTHNCDLVVSPDDSPLWPEHGVNHSWLPPGVYGPECEPVPPNPRRWPYDVVFVGSHPYPHPEWAKYRSDLITAFSRAFRGRFGILPRRGVPIRGRDLQELYATVPVVIGDTCLAGSSYQYTSDRIPETLGRGGFLIHPEVRGMVGTFPDDWYVGGADLMDYTLGDFTEAVDIAKDALRRPEEYRSIADHGRATVLARDTYAHRMGTVLAVAEGIHGGYRDVLPTEPPAHVIDKAKALGSMLPPTPTPRHSVQLHRWSAIFEPRPGTTDSEVIGEVVRDDYRLPREGFGGGVCVDVGANVGAFTVMAAKAGARVIAVEPEPQNRDRLYRHLAMNHVTDKVTVMAVAVTDHTGDRVRINGTAGGAHIDADGVEADTLSFHDLIDQAAPVVDMIKVDAEMAEWLAFESVTAEFLRERVKRISLEWHSPVVMPHLKHLDDGRQMERWGALVAKLADCGRLEICGHPMRGGLMWWKAF